MIKRFTYLITMICLFLLPFIGANALNNNGKSIYETIQSTMENALEKGSTISSLDESYYATYIQSYNEYISRYKLSKNSATITDLNNVDKTEVDTTDIDITDIDITEREVIIDHLNTKDNNADTDYDNNPANFDNTFEEDSYNTDVVDIKNEAKPETVTPATSEYESQTIESSKDAQIDEANDDIDSKTETIKSDEESHEAKTDDVVDSQTDTTDTITKTPITEETSSKETDIQGQIPVGSR